MKHVADNAREADKSHIAYDVLAGLPARYDEVAVAGLSASPTPEGRSRDLIEKKNCNLVVALRDRKDDSVGFVTNLRVPFINNQAEADLPIVNLRTRFGGPSVNRRDRALQSLDCLQAQIVAA